MLKHQLFIKQSPFFQNLNNSLVGVLCKFSEKLARSRDESSSLVDKLDKRQIVSLSDICVIFAESGRDMDNARAVGKSYIVVAGDVVCVFFLNEVKERLV